MFCNDFPPLVLFLVLSHNTAIAQEHTVTGVRSLVTTPTPYRTRAHTQTQTHGVKMLM